MATIIAASLWLLLTGLAAYLPEDSKAGRILRAVVSDVRAVASVVRGEK